MQSTIVSRLARGGIVKEMRVDAKISSLMVKVNLVSRALVHKLELNQSTSGLAPIMTPINIATTA